MYIGALIVEVKCLVLCLGVFPFQGTGSSVSNRQLQAVMVSRLGVDGLRTGK